MRVRAVLVALAWCALAACGAGRARRDAGETVVVSAVAFQDAGLGAALATLLQVALSARGVRARVAPAPAECAAPDSRACLHGVLGALARGEVHAALVPAARAPPPPALRDAGLEELGDAAPPAHRACWVLSPPDQPSPRSLLELADARVARHYTLPPDHLASLAHTQFEDKANTSDSCGQESDTCATILTSDPTEVAVLRAVVAEHGLRARVLAVDGEMLQAPAPPALVCGRALARASLERLGARVLSPPPCLAADCPFEARRLIKLVNARVLARTPPALRVLTHLALDDNELRVLATPGGPQRVLHAHPEWARSAAEVRVAVMIPASTLRQVHAAAALRAAAELAEEDEAESQHALAYKAELLDDECSGPRAFQYLTVALATEFGALSAVAGPACGAAFADVARQSAGLTLPVLAYTAQAPPPDESARLALLAAGDAHTEPAALGALLARLDWHRVSVLSELATRAALEPTRLAAQVVAHVELPPAERPDAGLVTQWAQRTAAGRGRVLYVCVEDARVARAALCAGRRAGLVPAAGAVWVLPAALPSSWLTPRADDPLVCSRAELEEVAEGYLSAAPLWAVQWRPPHEWAARWRRRCERAAPPAECETPPPHAGLLYDLLRLWAAALGRLLQDRPTAIDDLHRDDVLGTAVENATLAQFSGVTGAWHWDRADGARARRSELELHQWRAGAHVRVGTWADGTLRLDSGALRWATADGSVPDDGAERCALQVLAGALHADCSAAYAVAAALPLLLLAALLAVGAWNWRRRARREYRARLQALGMRALGPKPGSPDRWELPRERVVINRKLGAGAFGTVYGGHALLGSERGWAAVAVKMLKVGATTEEKLDFLAEAEAMKRFDHENVVRLLGVVTESEPVCTVMEFALYGDLKGYLLARRHLVGSEDAADEVAPARLTRMGADVARALAYLARLRYVHRDVAARNCLVSAQRRVKLADFGMTRMVFERDYYRFGRRGMLPVRWMAPESLALGVFSPATDVWAFGVLLYEIVTFGALPFQGLSNAQVLERVKAGRPLQPPPAASAPLVALMSACWRREAAARPRAVALVTALTDSPRLLVPCLDHVPLGALPLHLDLDLDPQSDLTRDATQARWESWGAPPSAGTDSTYLSAEPAPRDTDAFLPRPS